MFIQGIFHIFRDPPSGLPVIFGLYPDTDTDDHSAVSQAVHKYMVRFLAGHAVFLFLQYIGDHLFCQTDIRIVGNTNRNVDPPFILLCQIGQTGIGQAAIGRTTVLLSTVSSFV